MKQRKAKAKPTQAEIDQYEEYDSPWKEIIERFFPDCMHFFFPTIAAVIDWQKPPEFLDKELQRIVPRAKTNRQAVDKLVKVWLIDGDEKWFLIHIEVQSQTDGRFPMRMYIYNYRIYDKYNRRVVSLAILGDADTEWRPDRYEDEFLGCEVRLKFPIVKLLDYEAKWQALEASDNPFAVVVMAHLKTITTHGKAADRLYWKKLIVKELYKRGYSEQDVFDLFRFIDWIMKLPEELEKEIEAIVDEYEEAKTMKYVTSLERIARKEGLIEGKIEGKIEGEKEGERRGRIQASCESILQILQFRFQTDPALLSLLKTRLLLLEDDTLFISLVNSALEVASFTDFLYRLPEPTPKPAETSQGTPSSE